MEAPSLLWWVDEPDDRVREGSLERCRFGRSQRKCSSGVALLISDFLEVVIEALRVERLIAQELTVRLKV